MTCRLDEALLFATRLHANQCRPGTDIPYVAHLLGVAGIALSYGANDDEAIAALLHDAVEDQGGETTLEEIRRRFGDAVGAIVEACSDVGVPAGTSWRARKELYVAAIPRASLSTLLVSAADKLDNVRWILVQYRALGDAVWSRLPGGKDARLWYYPALVAAYRRAGAHRSLIDDLDRSVAELAQLVASQGC